MIKPTHKLAEVVAANINLLPIVFRFGIKANIGQATIQEICAKKGINLDFFLALLNTYSSDSYFPNTDTIDLKLLVDFLIRTHEYHKKITIPRLHQLINDLKAKLPGSKLTVTLEKYINDYVDDLIAHIDFEEKSIFPIVYRTLDESSPNKRKASITNLRKLFSQHNNVETEISDLILIIIQHLPENADEQLFHDLLHTLSHFEMEQLDHARFEDKILVPRLLNLLTQ